MIEAESCESDRVGALAVLGLGDGDARRDIMLDLILFCFVCSIVDGLMDGYDNRRIIFYPTVLTM